MKGARGRKRIDKRNYIASALCLISAVLLIFRYDYSIFRTWASLGDCWDSIKLWFGVTFADWIDLFGWKVTAEGLILAPADLGWKELVDFDFEAIYEKIVALGRALYDLDNLQAYLVWVSKGMLNVSRILLLVLPIWLILKIILKQIIFSGNKKEASADGVMVRFLKWVYKRLLLPVWRFVVRQWEFLCDKKGRWYRWILVALWLLNLNIITMGMELIAFYYFFLGTFFVDPASFFTESLLGLPIKGLIDIAVMFSGAPTVFWICVGWLLFDWLRRRKGLDLLRHREAMNCGFAKALPLVVLFVGPMGVKKTTMLTDIALSLVNVFRRNALEILFKYDLLFPNFPIQRFEETLKEAMEDHTVYNLPSVVEWVDALKYDGELFGYDEDTFGDDRVGALKVTTIYDALKEYGKAYFIYVCAQYIMSNYSIRTDDKKKDEKGCFPLWDGDFFQRDPRKQKELEKYAHILDQEILRLGKTVIEDSRNAGTFGFGIYTNTELGKSRGNQNSLEGVSKDAEEANQKNDLYPYSHKMIRHAEVMIDNKPFVSFLSDEQRPESIPADLRDNLEVVTILSCSKLELTMPNFAVADLIYHWIYEPAMETYYKLRNVRKDNCLLVFLLRVGVSLMSRFYARYYDQFGEFTLQVQKESGRAYGNNKSSAGDAEIHEYYLSTKKIYSNRFSTDCYSDFFKKRQLESDIGINDYPCYSGLKMTVEEMDQQHDYFIMDLFRIFAEKHPQEAPAEVVARVRGECGDAATDEFDPFG